MKKCLRWIIAILCLSVTATVCVSCGGTQAEKTELEAPIIASAVYTGETITATVPENEGYKVVTNDGGIHVGEYDVVLELSDASKYVWKSPDEADATKITLKFAITQADNEITKLTVANVVFGEATVAPAATAKFGTPTFTYSNSANGTFTETVPSAVGKYFVKATVAETADYKGATRTASFEITKTVPEFSTEPKAVEGTLVYNGSPQTLIAAGATDHGTIEYKLGKDGEWSETLPSGTDAGKYKVYYRIKGDESHADYEFETPIVVLIDNATPELTAPTAKTGLVYNGEALKLITAGSTTGGELQYKLGDGQWGTTVPVATDAKANYVVYYRVAGNKNYNDIAEASLTVSIGKAAPAFTKDPKAVEGLKYDKSEKTLIAAGETDHGTIEYKLGENGTYGADLPKATNAGEYKVYYRIIGDKNHNDYEFETPITVNIEKADNEITVGNIDIKYGDDPVQNATATAGNITYLYISAHWEGEGGDKKPVRDTGELVQWNKANEVGLYYCEITASETENYKPATKSPYFNVLQADNEITVSGSYDIEYGKDLIQNATATSGAVTYTYYKAKEESGKLVKDGNAITWSKTDCKPGLYCCVIAAGNKNYENKEQDVFFHVTQATSKIAKFELTANTFKCGEQVGYNEEHTGGNAVIRFSRAKDGEYVNAITFNANANDGVGNGFDYYAKLFIDETDCYTHAQTEGIKFNLYHSFGADGVCTACHNAQTGIIYAEDGDVAYVSGYDGNPSTEVYVRSTYNNKPVTYVKAKAFEGKNEITKIVFPESVTDLQDLAFNHCTALEYVDIRSVKKLSGGNVFLNCDNLRTVIIGSGYQATNQQFNTQSTEFTAKIELCVNGTGTVTIWPTDRLIKDVFYLQNDTAELGFLKWRFGENGTIEKEVGYSYSADGTLTITKTPSGLTYTYGNNEYYVSGYNGSDTTITIPATYNDGSNGEKNVTYIAAEVFKETKIRRVILSDKVTELKGAVFFNCSALNYVDMRGVTIMSGNNNFLNCRNLRTVIIGNGYAATDQQFVNQDADAPVLNLLVYGTTTATLNHKDTLVKNDLFYLQSDAEDLQCAKWRFGANGIEMKEHVYDENGKCTACGAYNTMGVAYSYYTNADGSVKTYYVSGYNGHANAITVLGKYSDGEHGEYAVTYIGKEVFKGKDAIKKVILPESVTDLGGGAFMKCTSLEYIDMRGVKSLIQANCAAGPDGSIERNNNFLGCTALKTVVVGSGFKSDVGQFHETNKPNLYVYGAEGAGEAPSTGDAEGMIGNIYYYSKEGAPGCWNYVDGVATLHQ